MAHYIIQVVLFQLLFLLVYDVLLKKETFFAYNRWYLLITPVIALILPLLKFETLGNMVPPESMVMLPEVYLGGKPTSETIATGTTAASGNSINWWLIIYATGALANVLLFIKKYRVLKSLFKNRIISAEENLKIVQVKNSSMACTFFNTVFLGDALKEEEIQQILSHEKVHAEQNHSADLLFFELMKIIFWFNPLVYIYQSRISTLHEFIADAGVIKTVEKKTYYQQLLNTAFNTENISFINQFFNHSLIKKRIVMLQKSKSRTISKFKYLILLPLMLAMLTYVSCSEEIDDGAVVTEQNSEADKSPSADKNAIGDVPFSIVDEVPIFPGCEHLTSNEVRKVCMSEQITAFVASHFDVEAAMPYARAGMNRIYVQFRITKDGSVEVAGIRAASPELEEEARKAVNQLPQMIPGKQKGEKVDVLYSLPISFQAGEGGKVPTPTRYEKVEKDFTGDVPFAVIDEVPVFPGCEDLASNEERKACMSNKITEHINANFDIGLGKELGLKGTNRIYVQFKITEDGNIDILGARAPHPALEEEAKRAVNTLPQMTPGKQKGKKVGVLYSLPITFNAGE